MSHSSGVRGLKQVLHYQRRNHSRSHSSGVRGLKPDIKVFCFACISVALLGGAWIETIFAPNIEDGESVALLGGAWIET